MRASFKILSVVGCLQLGGCVTPYQEDVVWDHWPESDVDAVSQEVPEAHVDVADDIRRLSQVNYPLSEDEWSGLQELIEDYGVGPEKDALTVLSLVRKSLEQDPATDLDQEKSETVTLEALARDAGVDIPSVLQGNPYLVSSDFYSLALRAVERDGNSHEFREKSLHAIRQRARSWMSLGRALGMSEELTATADSADQPQQAPVMKQISIEDIDQGNLTFEQAQKVADSGEYQEAIRMLENLAQTSPSHKVMAEAKIKEICNTAVQELRQQAATAFQNAVPMSNEQARARYLKSAQEHLQQALNLYPEAENLETVRENLAVINSTLERMTGQTGSM